MSNAPNMSPTTASTRYRVPERTPIPRTRIVRSELSPRESVTRQTCGRWQRVSRPIALLLTITIMSSAMALWYLNSGGRGARSARADRGAEFVVAMPAVAPGGLVALKPIRIVVMIRDAPGRAWRRREISAIRRWLRSHHSPASRLLIARGGRRRPRSTRAAVRQAFANAPGPKLLVTFSDRRTSDRPQVAVVRLEARDGVPVPASVPVSVGHTTSVPVDMSVHQAAAGAVARAAMSLSGMRERREAASLRPQKKH